MRHRCPQSVKLAVGSFQQSPTKLKFIIAISSKIIVKKVAISYKIVDEMIAISSKIIVIIVEIFSKTMVIIPVS